MKNTIIQIFPTMADAFEWVSFRMLDAVVGNIRTKEQFRGNDAVIGEDDNTIYVGLYNVDQDV